MDYHHDKHSPTTFCPPVDHDIFPKNDIYPIFAFLGIEPAYGPTCRTLHPPIILRDLYSTIDHHYYSSADIEYAYIYIDTLEQVSIRFDHMVQFGLDLQGLDYAQYFNTQFRANWNRHYGLNGGEGSSGWSSSSDSE